MNFGLQTFTIRKAQKKDLESAYLPLVKMGIFELEIARIDFNEKNAKQIKDLSQKISIFLIFLCKIKDFRPRLIVSTSGNSGIKLF